MEMNYESLLRRAKQGQLADDELEKVVEELQRPESREHHYTLLHIIGRSGATKYRKLVEEFLTREDNPFLARLALQTLCTYWNTTHQYLPQVLEFLRGVPWDEFQACRLIAASIAGEYLLTNSEPTLLNELLRIFESEKEGQSMKEAAYFAIARAMGQSYRDMPPASRELDMNKDIDLEIIAGAKQRLSREMPK